MPTIVEALAGFTTEIRFEDLPANVVEESKRILLDSIGCALGGLSHPKGTIGVQYARLMGAGAPGAQATILGTGEKVSTVGAGFANGELINALDFDAILPLRANLAANSMLLMGVVGSGDGLPCG
jgi:2-methylcitrate dehydratase PrpD